MVLVVKNPPATGDIKYRRHNTGDIKDAGLIPGLGRFPGGGHGNPLQYSCLEKPMNRGVWQSTVPRIAKSPTQLKRLSMHASMHCSWGSCSKNTGVVCHFLL